MIRVLICAGILLIASGCAGSERSSATPVAPAPRVRVLGVAQDGGVPHAGCSCDTCLAALVDPARRFHVASLAIILPPDANERKMGVFLIDATPDVTEQLHMLRDVRDAPDGRTDRAPVDGVFLTHAHIGHYTGLMHFGFEVMHAQRTPVWCTERMGEFLRTNAPWSQLVDKDEIRLPTLTIDDPLPLGSGVTITPVEVPHRNEFADTVGYVIAGPARTILYIPDTEPWDRWPEGMLKLEHLLRIHSVDVALLDATFYSLDELPNRHAASIGHPLIVSTMDRLQERSDAGLDVRFIHLNHTNPALDPGSDAQREIERRGFTVAREGAEIGL
ncbi:MAG: coenzyme PQQ synthesis protein B [Phycisphaeraceae bacterium]|nr:MAG: coenzyme PQQ synthesis protein B [Phycisphaeraceae bacterium]